MSAPSVAVLRLFTRRGAALGAPVLLGMAACACAQGQDLQETRPGADTGGQPTGGGAGGRDGPVTGTGGGPAATGGSVGAGGAGGASVGGTGGGVGAGGASGGAASGGAPGGGGAGGTLDAGGGAAAVGGSAGAGGAAGGVGGAGGATSGDGSACSTSAECVNGPCLGGFCCGAAGCADDGDPCTSEACATGTGACVHAAGGNQDGDRLEDCAEDDDGIVSTSKYVFNGMTASLIGGNGGGNCTEICLASQIASLFSNPVETRDIYSGWEFNTDQPQSQAPNSATFGFMPPFTSTITGWRMLYRGLFWVPASATGQYCFNVDIGSDGGSGTTDTSPDACGAIYLPDVQGNAWVMNGRHQSSTSDSPPMPSESNQRTKCTTFAAGPQRIDFVYQYSANNADNRHQLHVKYCYGNAAACTPTTPIDDAVLTPVGATIPTCADGVQNGGETGLDCGGPDCAGC